MSQRRTNSRVKTPCCGGEKAAGPLCLSAAEALTLLKAGASGKAFAAGPLSKLLSMFEGHDPRTVRPDGNCCIFSQNTSDLRQFIDNSLWPGQKCGGRLDEWSNSGICLRLQHIREQKDC
jgi:hypothetical protein